MVKIEKNIVIVMVLVLLVSGVYILYTSTTVNGTEILTPPVWEDEIPETIVTQLGETIHTNWWFTEYWYYSGIVPNTDETVVLISRNLDATTDAAINVYAYLGSEFIFTFRYVDKYSSLDLVQYNAKGKYKIVGFTKQEIFLERVWIQEIPE